MDTKQFLVTLFLLSLLLVNTSLAQEDAYTRIATSIGQAWNTIVTWLLPYAGIIFVLIFIFILLLVAGIIHMPTGAPSLSLVVFTVLVILAFAFPLLISKEDFDLMFPTFLKEIPDEFKGGPVVPYFDTALSYMGLPTNWNTVPAIIFLLLLPFAAIFTIVWAFLVSLGIFTQKNVNRLLALIITLLTIPTGSFIRMIWLLFTFMGGWSIAIFAATFVLGIFFRGAGIAAKEHMEFKKYVGKTKELYHDVVRELKEAKNLPLERM